MDNSNPIEMPMEYIIKLPKNNEGEKVDLTLYKSRVGSLCYLICTKPLKQETFVKLESILGVIN